MTDLAVTAVASGQVNIKEFSPVLDVALIRSSQMDELTKGGLSILTTDKSGEVAESYRSATYSILEILGLE
jgi:hypothetical protein